VAELIVDGANLVFRMTSLQRLVSFHGDLRAPLTAVRSISVVEKPWLALRGRRMAGFVMRGVAAMGTWVHSGLEYDFCIVRGEQQAIQVELNDGRFVRWLVGRPVGTNLEQEADQLCAAAGIARA
jgi:hypothetical protein